MSDMGWFGKSSGKAPSIDRRESLRSIPAINPGVSVEHETDGRAMVTIVTRRPQGLLSRFMSPTIKRQVHLDQIGTFVLDQINGSRTVQDLADAFVARYRLNKREAELSMAEYIRSLAQRNIVSIGIGTR